MKEYGSAAAFKTALEDRVRRQARTAGIDLSRMWSIVAFDRLLARLLTDGFVLKGGYSMELRVKRARATKDVDLSALSMKRDEELLAELQALAAKDLGDHFVLTIGRPTMEIDAAPYGGARFPVRATIAGGLIAQFNLDVGVGDAVTGPFEEVEGRGWFDFAGLPRPRFRMISKEQQFAEKLHAYTLPREGTPNSRVKDLVDMVLLVDLGLDPSQLKKALRATFERRGTHVLPTPVPDPPADWTKPFAALAGDCGLKHDAASAIATVRDCLTKL